MKSINAKKMLVLAGTAVLLGSALAAADVSYGSTQLVDHNGVPTAKIYVGSGASISDGVAAANIAATIANMAYTSSTLTAGTSGTPSCASGTGSTACSVVPSSRQVTLDVNTPGQAAGTYQFKTLITDTIDRTLANRVTDSGNDIYSTGLASADTSTTPLSPVRGSLVSDTIEQGRLFQIGGSQFTAFADYNVVDNQAVGASYNEQQAFWVGTQNGNPVAYDTNTKSVDVNNYDLMAYSLLFTDMGTQSDGIPVCTDTSQSNTTDDWTSCGLNSNSLTATHRVPINFMGQSWIITDMSPPSGALASATGAINGGSIKLAQEAKYGIVNVGGILDTGTFQIRLSDISVGSGVNNDHPAIIDILDETGTVVGQVQVAVGQTYTYVDPGTGQSVLIHVYNTAPGFTLNAKWAEMAVFTNEETLTSGSNYDTLSADQNLYVNLLWKNKGYTGSSGGASTQPDSLREITIYQYNQFGNGATVPGSVYSFPASAPAFSLTYNGVDLQNSEYVPLSFQTEGPEEYTVSTSPGNNAGCTATATYTKAKMVEASVGSQALFGGTSSVISGSQMVNTVNFDPVGMVNVTYNNGTSTVMSAASAFGQTNVSSINEVVPTTSTYNDPTAWSPMVFWQAPGATCYYWEPLTYNSAGYDASQISNAVEFDTAGSNSNAQGELYLVDNATGHNIFSANMGSTYQAAIVYQEDAGQVNAASNNPVQLAAPIVVFDSQNTVSANGQYKFQPANSNQENTYYQGLSVGQYGTPSAQDSFPFITERGSEVTSVSSTGVDISVADRVGMPTFTFALANAAEANASDAYTLGVGQSQVFGGTTVTVADIAALSSGSSNNSGCSIDPSSVSSVILPYNTPTYQTKEMVPISGSLVELDTQAASDDSNVEIVVGGPDVNSLAQGVSITPQNNVVVQVIGNKIIVAGFTAQDTETAVAQFIAGIKAQ